MDTKAEMLALLAKITGTDKMESEEEVKEKVNIPLPPSTLDEFLEQEKLRSFPEKVDLPELVVENCKDLESIDSIVQLLRLSVPLKLSACDKLMESALRLQQLSDTLVCRYRVQTDDPPADRHADIARTYDKFINRKRGIVAPVKAEVATATLEDASFPGFDAHAPTPLPSAVDAGDIVARVLRAQRWPPKIKQQWRRLLTSDAALCLLHDVFWWTFLETCEASRADRERHQANLRARVAEKFVCVSVGHRASNDDRLLRRLADVLAQAVFATYCAAFADSHAVFDAGFKAALAATVSDWMFGLQVAPRSSMSWDVCALGHEANLLGDNRNEAVASVGRAGGASTTSQRLLLRHSHSPRVVNDKLPKHPLFNTRAKGPLLEEHMQSLSLSEEKLPLRKHLIRFSVKAGQVSGADDGGVAAALTSRRLMVDTARQQAGHRVKTVADLMDIEMRRRTAMLKISILKNQLQNYMSKQEIRILCERILSRREEEEPLKKLIRRLKKLRARGTTAAAAEDVAATEEVEVTRP